MSDTWQRISYRTADSHTLTFVRSIGSEDTNLTILVDDKQAGHILFLPEGKDYYDGEYLLVFDPLNFGPNRLRWFWSESDAIKALLHFINDLGDPDGDDTRA